MAWMGSLGRRRSHGMGRTETGSTGGCEMVSSLCGLGTPGGEGVVSPNCGIGR